MDTRLTEVKRAFYARPNIETLERYAIELIRSGIDCQPVRIGRSDFANETHGTQMNRCTLEMCVMAELETQRRRDEGVAGPLQIALWLDCEAGSLIFGDNKTIRESRVFQAVGYEYIHPETQATRILL